MTAPRLIRLIRGGRIIDPAQQLNTIRDLWIDESGKITTKATALKQLADNEIIDAKGHYVLPGIIDLSARFREPGQENKADICHESAAALHSGITQVCLQADTLPVIDTPAVVDLIQQKAEATTSPAIHTLGAMTIGLQGKQLSEYAALKKAGCVGVSNADRAIADNQMMRNIMEYAASHGLKVFMGTTDRYLSASGCVHEGRVSARMGLHGIPTAAEAIAISRDLILIETTGVNAHFGRLSTAAAVELIAQAQQRGLNVTADVAAHQLHLTENDILNFNSQAHVLPPLRTLQDRDKLREAVANNTIQAICSDHQPHEPDAKLAPFAETEPGISALETLLPLTLKLVQDGILTLDRAIESITHKPACILQAAGGTLNEGTMADITIIDPEAIWTLTADTMLSRGNNTPFDGWQFQGKVTHTLLQGKLV